MAEEVWHLVEGKREDGVPSIFRIRDLAPRLEQPKIFVVEVFYATPGLARLPDVAGYRRLAQFEEQWLVPACNALGWTFVAAKIEDGSAFLYVYGDGDTTPMIERLSPFDPALGFFDEADPGWEEYAALHELLDRAKTFAAAPPLEPPPKRASNKRAKVTSKLKVAVKKKRATTRKPRG